MICKYAEIFCWKNVSSFCNAKATHIFSAKNFRILYIESAKTVNEMTLNELVKLTTLWTTGPWYGEMIHFHGRQCQTDFVPFWKGVFPRWSKFFPYRETPFPEGTLCAKSKQKVKQKCGLPQRKWSKVYQVYPIPLTHKLYIPSLSIMMGTCFSM